MPGIVGIITPKRKDRSESELHRMVTSMMHESFYVSGTYSNEEMGFYGGWISQKGSFSDCMPVTNEKQDLILLYTGDNYCDRSLIDYLRNQGHQFDEHDASYLLHLYEEKGDEAFRRLNGWFCGIVIDIKKRTMKLFNDRFGMSRVYYYEEKDRFIFSSEAKALLTVLPDVRSADPKGLEEFIRCGCVLENRTLFRGIKTMPGGALWTFRSKACHRKGYYFRPQTWEAQESLDREEFFGRYKETFISVLPRYFRSGRKTAISLTGGLDTRMIMAHVDEPQGALPCYTFGGMYRDCLDVKIARKVATLCRQDHTVLNLSREYLDDFGRYAEKAVYISDGCFDVSGSYEVYLNRLARNVAPVRITGNYGSEILRNVSSFKLYRFSDRVLNPDYFAGNDKVAETLKRMNNGHDLTFTVFKEIPWKLYGYVVLAQSQLSLRAPFMDNDLVKITYQAPAELHTSPEMSLRLISEGNHNLCELYTDRGIGGNSPFLPRRLRRVYYEFLFKAEYLYNIGMPHWMAKLNTAFDFLRIEMLFLGHHKFHHFRKWFREDLSEYVRGTLLDERSRERAYLNASYVEKMVADHIKGKKNYTHEIMTILTLELIHRLFIDRPVQHCNT